MKCILQMLSIQDYGESIHCMKFLGSEETVEIGCILKEGTMSESVSEFALIPIGNVQHPKHFGVIYNKLLTFQDTCHVECYSGFLNCT